MSSNFQQQYDNFRKENFMNKKLFFFFSLRTSVYLYHCSRPSLSDSSLPNLVQSSLHAQDNIFQFFVWPCVEAVVVVDVA